MNKISTAKFKGESGNQYSFEVYNWEAIFRQDVAGVYCIARRYKLADGSFTLDAIYIGEHNDLSLISGFHRKQSCFQEHNANVRCVYLVKDKEHRDSIVQDLLDHYTPPCNR